MNRQTTGKLWKITVVQAFRSVPAGLFDTGANSGGQFAFLPCGF